MPCCNDEGKRIDNLRPEESRREGFLFLVKRNENRKRASLFLPVFFSVLTVILAVQTTPTPPLLYKPENWVFGLVWGWLTLFGRGLVGFCRKTPPQAPMACSARTQCRHQTRCEPVGTCCEIFREKKKQSRILRAAGEEKR